MESKENILSSKAITYVIIFAILSRVTIAFLWHLPNFSPVDAVALFCGAYLRSRFSALLTTFLSVLISDLLVNWIYLNHWTAFYPGFYWQYVCYLLIILLGCALYNRLNMINLISASLFSSVLFFIVSNFGVWFSNLLYPLTLHGLEACYIAAIPFFENTLISDLFYSLLFFGSVAIVQRNFLLGIKLTKN